MRFFSSFLPTLLLLGLLASCSPPQSEPTQTEPPAIKLPDSVKILSVADAAALIQNTSELAILDLREDWEMQKQGRIAGATWADWLNEARFNEAVAKIPPTRPCLLYCAIGGRARLAAQTLATRGFQHLSILDDGFESWVKAGKPVQR